MDSEEESVVSMERGQGRHKVARIVTPEEFLREARPRRDADDVVLTVMGQDVRLTPKDLRRMLRDVVDRMPPQQAAAFMDGLLQRPKDGEAGNEE